MFNIRLTYAEISSSCQYADRSYKLCNNLIIIMRLKFFYNEGHEDERC